MRRDIIASQQYRDSMDTIALAKLTPTRRERARCRGKSNASNANCVLLNARILGAGSSGTNVELGGNALIAEAPKKTR